MSHDPSTEHAPAAKNATRRRVTLPKPFALVVLFALCIIPMIYAATLIWANDDPTGNIDSIPAALVNEDVGSTLTSPDDTTTRVDLGDEVVDALIDEHGNSIEGFDWTLTDADSAAAGLADGTYLAVLTVPEDFSETATSSATVDPADADQATPGTLRIETNDATNYINGNIASTLGKNLTETLAKNVSATYLENIYLGFTTMHDSIADAADGAVKLSDGTVSLANGASDLNDGLHTMASATSALPAGAAILSNGANRALAGSQELGVGLDQLATGSATLAEGTGKALEGAIELTTKLKQLSSSTPVLVGGSIQVSDGLDQLIANYDRLSDDARKAALADLAIGANQVEEGATNVNVAAAGLAAGGDLLIGSTESGKGLVPLTAGAQSLRDGAAAAASGGSTLTAGLVELSTGAGTLSSKLATLTGSIATAAEGSQTLASGADEVQNGSGTLASGLVDGLDSIPTYSNAQAKTLSESAALPVALDSVRENEVANNGTGIAPYFLALGLWIGALAVFFMRPALNERLVRSRTPFPLVALRSYLPNAIIALIQSVLAVLFVHAVVDIDIVNLPGVFALAALASVTFMAINQGLIALLGPPGRFVGLLLTVVQLAAAGGTYPIETAAPFFQTLHAWLPLTDAVQGFRTFIAGGSLEVGGWIWSLVAWFVGAILVSIFAAYRARRRALVTDAAAAGLLALGEQPLHERDLSDLALND